MAGETNVMKDRQMNQCLDGMLYWTDSSTNSSKDTAECFLTECLINGQTD